MIDYVYTAKDRQTGDQRKGKVSAQSKNAAAALLMEKQLYPIKIEEAATAEPFWKKNAFGTGVSPKDKVLFTRQLSTLVKAGLPITQALDTAIEQVGSASFKSTLRKVATSVEGGVSLADSFAQFPRLFDHIYISLVSAGETSGTLDETLVRLADQQEKQQQIIRKVRGALIYPIIVLVVIVGVVIFMVTTVLPQVGNLYKELGRNLPFITASLLGVSNFLLRFWYVFLLLLIAVIFGIRAYAKTPKGEKAFDRLKLNLPVVSPLLRRVYAARFTRTLSSLVNSGVPLLEAMDIAGEAVDNLVIYDIVTKGAEQVRSGAALSDALSGHNEIPKLVPQMIAVGEQAGALGTMLKKVADYYEDEVDQTVKNLSGIIEPVMIVFLGIIVIFIVVAVLFPIYNLVTLINVNGGSSSATGAGF